MVVAEYSGEGRPKYRFYIYGPTYYFTFSSTAATLTTRPNRSTNTIFLGQQFFDPLYPAYLHALRHCIRAVTSVFGTKMKFKGKGYYVYKNFRNTIAPQFGYAHRVYVYAFNISVKFLSKTSVLLFGLSRRDILSVGYDFRSRKPINIFTKGGSFCPPSYLS